MKQEAEVAMRAGRVPELPFPGIPWNRQYAFGAIPSPARAGEGMAPKAYWRFQGMPGKGSSGTLPALMATSASCFMPHLVPRARTPPNCLGNVTFTLGGLALQAPAFSQPWGTPWAFDPDPPLGQPLEAGP